MLARFILTLPYAFMRPATEELPPWTFDHGGYEVIVHPPYRAAGHDPAPGEESTLNDAPAVEANLLVIDFRKDDFDRRPGSETGNRWGDPPHDELFDVANIVLLRLRAVTQSPSVKPLELGRVGWMLRYLSDDGQPLEPDPSRIRGRGAEVVMFSWTALTAEAWAAFGSLPDEYKAPVWTGLLLDARALLPEVGPALVLAMTAIETGIEAVLDHLAAKASMPPGLWEWINGRGQRSKAPSPDEQLSELLGALSGESLKNTEHWEPYKNLKTARNSFVHDGRAHVGGFDVSPAKAAEFIEGADLIVEWLERLLPPQLRRYRPSEAPRVTMSKRVFEVPSSIARDSP